jgi:DNA-directed RNA polymerase
MGSSFIEIMESCDLVEQKINSNRIESVTLLRLTNEVSALLGKNVNKAIAIPLNLPMIVKPKRYSSEEYGGYLLNGEEVLWRGTFICKKK